jgi:hypothetical protein
MTITPAQRATLAEAEQSESAALSLRAQAEAFEAEALALRASVYAELDAVPIDPPIDPPPVDPVEPIEPPVYDTLPTFKSGAPGAWSVYDLTGKRFNQQLNLRRFSFVHVIGGTYETPDTCFYCDGGSDIEVVDATFTGPPVASINVQRARIINSTRVYLRDCTVIGGLATTGVPQGTLPLDATGNVIGMGTGEGIYFYNCTDCGATGCDVSLLHQGIIVGGLVHIHDNRIHHIRTTAIAGSPRSGSTFLGNVASDVTTHMYGGAGDHGDNPIHIWTTGSDIDGLVIDFNEYRQGTGTPTMGIFLQAKSGNFTNLSATGNIIETAQGQGWRVDGCSGVINDTVLIWTDPNGDPKSQPRLDVNAPSHDLAINNTKGIVTVDAGLVNITIDGVMQ